MMAFLSPFSFSAPFTSCRFTNALNMFVHLDLRISYELSSIHVSSGPCIFISAAHRAVIIGTQLSLLFTNSKGSILRHIYERDYIRVYYGDTKTNLLLYSVARVFVFITLCRKTHSR